MIPLTEDEVTSIAADLLDAPVTDAGEFYIQCPGCALNVHHTDTSQHARECPPLRALALVSPEAQ